MESLNEFEGVDPQPERHRDLDEITGDLDALWREWRRLQSQHPAAESGSPGESQP